MIHRIKKEKNFTILYNDVLRDPDLSAKAKGIWAYLMSLPDDWKVYQTELQKHFTNGSDSLRSGMKELVDKGYASVTAIRDEKGKIDHWDTSVYEVSCLGKPRSGEPCLGKPRTTKDLSYELLKEQNTKNTEPSAPSGDSPKTKSDHQKIVDYFYDNYRMKTGEKPSVDGGYLKTVKELLKLHDVETIRKRIDNFFTGDYWFTRDGYSILQFRKYFDVLAGKKTDDGIDEELYTV